MCVYVSFSTPVVPLLLIKLSQRFMCLTTCSQWGPLVVCLTAFWLIGHGPTGAACYTHCCLQGLAGIEDAKVNISPVLAVTWRWQSLRCMSACFVLMFNWLKTTHTLLLWCCSWAVFHHPFRSSTVALDSSWSRLVTVAAQTAQSTTATWLWCHSLPPPCWCRSAT